MLLHTVLIFLGLYNVWNRYHTLYFICKSPPPILYWQTVPLKVYLDCPILHGFSGFHSPHLQPCSPFRADWNAGDHDPVQSLWPPWSQQCLHPCCWKAAKLSMLYAAEVFQHPCILLCRSISWGPQGVPRITCPGVCCLKSSKDDANPWCQCWGL